MITISLGSVEQMQANSLGLFEQHYQELTLHKDIIKLDPDWAQYLKLQALGMLAVFVAKDNEQLIGYSVFFVHNSHLHYKHLKVASNDVLFVTKPYRTTSNAGLKLIKFADKYFQETLGAGCKIVYHIKEANDFSPILKRYGYTHEEIIMGKVIG